MTKVRRPTVVEYSWGQDGPKLEAEAGKPWWYRLGIRDAKRRIVLLVMLCYASGLAVALSMRNPVLVRINPIRTTSLYRVNAAGEVENQFSVSVSNRGSQNAKVAIAVDSLQGARVEELPNPLYVAPGETTRQDFAVAVPRGAALGDVTHFHFQVEAQPGGRKQTIDMTWLMPPKTKR